MNDTHQSPVARLVDSHAFTGFIVAVRGGLVDTVEGNTDASKTREGGGVYKLTRKLSEINKGCLDYSGT